MRAGDLFHVVSIERPATARDAAFNSEVVTWVPFAEGVRASCSDVSGDESVSQGLRVASRTVKVTIRWRAGVEADMRVKQSDGRVYQITAVLEIPRRKGLELMCQEYSAPFTPAAS